MVIIIVKDIQVWLIKLYDFSEINMYSRLT